METLENEDKAMVIEKIWRFNKIKIDPAKNLDRDFGGKDQESENIITMTRNRSD